MDLKVCIRCKEEKSIDDFYLRKNKSGEKVTQTYCKKCMNNATVKSYMKRYNEYKTYQKNYINKVNFIDFTNKNNISKYIGCSFNDFKSHLETSAIENGYYDFNLNWNDYTINFKKSIDNFNLRHEVDKLNFYNYKNIEVIKKPVDKYSSRLVEDDYDN